MNENHKKHTFFRNEWQSDVVSGMALISKKNEYLLKNCRPDLKELCDACDFDFVSPCFHAVLNGLCPSKALAQSIYGLLPQKVRGELSGLQFHSDAAGIIYAPGLGYKKVSERSQGFDVSKDSMDTANWIAETIVHNMNVQQHTSVFFEGLFDGMTVKVGFDNKVLNNLTTALDLIKAVAPEYYKSIQSVTKTIVPFDSLDTNSFAANNSFGAIFTNTHWGTSVPYFVEDLAHQCGHLVFTSMTVNPNELFSVAPSMPLSEVTTSRSSRNIYTLLHALFTYCAISTCLSRVLEEDRIGEKDRFETLGRLAFTLRKFQSDLILACKLTVLTDAGKGWVRNAAVRYRTILSKHSEHIGQFSMKGQQYNFCLDVFLRHN